MLRTVPNNAGAGLVRRSARYRATEWGVADIQQLARDLGGPLRIEVRLSGDLAELSPSVGAGLYRLAQESVTNAVRHARHATRVTVHVAEEREQVRLTVRDDGDPGQPVRRPRATASSA